jgi:rhodanese-related sulfurtransferase
MNDMQDLNPAEFGKALRANHDAVLLDVRTPEEFEEGHLPGALNIDIRGYDFHEQIETLDPTKAYFVYCRSGGRSSAACKFMNSKGFQEVHNLAGGILAWDGEVE